LSAFQHERRTAGSNGGQAYAPLADPAIGVRDPPPENVVSFEASSGRAYFAQGFGGFLQSETPDCAMKITKNAP